MKYIIFAYESYPLPIAKHLMNEGRDYAIGMVDNIEYLKVPGYKDSDEKPEDKKQRMSNYDGMIKKNKAKDVMDFLSKVKSKDMDDYFFFFDFNYFYNLSQEILKMGFRKGIFPTEYYFKMEKEREMAKQFVKKNYDKVKVAEYTTFTKVEDGIKKIQESDEMYVLKSNGNSGPTVVHKTDDIKTAKKQMIDTLKEFKKGYEEGGFVLEKFIPNALELTPVMVFWNGTPIYSLVEFENKQYGAGNVGSQKGGNQVLNCQTQLDCRINKIAFPKAIYELANKQPGLSIYDSGLMYDGKDFWFTEFCAMRYGWDGILSEMVMTGDDNPFVAKYFETIASGKNPLKQEYGAAIRLFNYEGDMETTSKPRKGEAVYWEESIENNLFLYGVKKEGDDIVTTNDKDFVAAVTASGTTSEQAVKKLYKRLDEFNFSKLFYRPKFDFLSKDYRSSIPNRMEAVEEYL